MDTLTSRGLFDLITKGRDYLWGPTQQVAFKTLKAKLLSTSIMAHYNPEWDVIFRTDASRVDIGGTLINVTPDCDAKQERLIACYSRTLRCAEKNYSANHLECLAINEAIKHYRPELWRRKFRVETDHRPCCSIVKSRDKKNIQAEWALELSEYDYEPIYKRGKFYIYADYLSRHPSPTQTAPEDDDLLALRATALASRKTTTIEIAAQTDGAEELPGSMEDVDRDEFALNQYNDGWFGPVLQRILTGKITDTDKDYKVQNTRHHCVEVLVADYEERPQRICEHVQVMPSVQTRLPSA